MRSLVTPVGQFENRHGSAVAARADAAGSRFFLRHDGGHKIGPLDSPKPRGLAVLSSAHFSGAETVIADVWESAKRGVRKMTTTPLTHSVEQFESKYLPTMANSADEIGDWFSKLYGEHTAVPLESAKSNETVTLSTAAFAGVTSTLGKYRFSARGTSLVDVEQYCLAIPLAGSCVIGDSEFGEVVCDSNKARLFRRDAGTSVAVSAGSTILSLGIPSDLLEERARSLYDKELGEPLRFSPTIDLHTVQSAAIVYSIDHLLTMLSSADNVLDHEILRESLLDFLVTTFLGSLPHNYAGRSHASNQTAVPAIVRRAEEWMRENAGEPITVARLAREAGCSERALQYAFKSFRETSPMAVLRDIRLEHARADLMLEGAKVADVAFKWGFSNPGRFAVQYEAKYFEKPSQSARKTLT